MATSIREAWAEAHFAHAKQPTVSVRKSGDFYIVTICDRRGVRRGIAKFLEEAIQRAR